MKRVVSVFAVLAAVVAMAIPAGAQSAKGHTDYALAGEARALELAIGEQGVTLGLALARGTSVPKAIGVGAGQCTLLGSEADPDNLPCNEESTVKTQFPGVPGDGNPKCAATLPAPLNAIVDLKIACGSSKSGVSKGAPTTRSTGKVAHLGVTLPVGTVFANVPVNQLVGTLTDTLAPVLDLAPKEVQDAVDNVVELVTGLAETEALAVELGPSTSSISSKDGVITVDSASAGALIGLVGIPEASVDGTAISATSDPLKNGLVIIEVGTSRASASLNEDDASAAGAASAALVTVKVRDITKPKPTYVEVSVAPGETVTVLEGTPAESTIVAADSTVSEDGNEAAAAADAVRLHLLKGVNGGVSLALARSTAAVQGNRVLPAPPIKKAPEVLPLTGGTDATIPALALILAAGAALLLRRRVSA
jgi:hypothetical protein